MKVFLIPFAFLAATGLVLSVIVHTAALLGQPSPMGELSWALHMGIFVVWIPTIFAAEKLTKDFKRKDFWMAALRACPKWMKMATYAFFGYAFFNFLRFAGSGVGMGHGHTGNGPTPATVFWGFSGHWMAFYSAGLAVLYSAIHAEENDNARRCRNGHPVGPAAKFCEECGAEVRVPKNSRYKHI